MARRVLPILAITGVVGLWGLMAFVPAERLPTPTCQIRTWTGLHCPGCGGTRAARALSQGHLAAAARNNVLVFPVVLVLIWGMVALAANRWGGKRWWTSQRTSLALALVAGVAMVAFTILRNLEVGSFLRP